MIDWAYVVWNLATSVSQLFFGYWGDCGRGAGSSGRARSLAVLCMSSIGLVDSFAMLCVLLILGGLGIAAFHPEAAAIAGACSPGIAAARCRSSPSAAIWAGRRPALQRNGHHSLRGRALTWGLVWGLGGALLLALGFRRTPAVAVRHRGPVAGPRCASRCGGSRPRWGWSW